MSEQAPDRTPRHRLNHLLGMAVRFADGREDVQVTDVRLEPGEAVRGALAELVVDGLVVGRRRPGTLLGYNRHPSMGPWLIRVIVRALHRHTGYVPWTDIDRIDWDGRVVHLRTNQLLARPPFRDEQRE